MICTSYRPEEVTAADEKSRTLVHRFQNNVQTLCRGDAMRLPGDAWHRPYTDLTVVRRLKLTVLGIA